MIYNTHQLAICNNKFKCTPEELNRRERRRASNRKAAQSARDRRVQKQEQLEQQINKLLEEQKMHAEEKTQVKDQA